MFYIFPKHIPRKKGEIIFKTKKHSKILCKTVHEYRYLKKNAKREREKQTGKLTARSNKDVEDGKNE